MGKDTNKKENKAKKIEIQQKHIIFFAFLATFSIFLTIFGAYIINKVRTVAHEKKTEKQPKC